MFYAQVTFAGTFQTYNFDTVEERDTFVSHARTLKVEVSETGIKMADTVESAKRNLKDALKREFKD